MADNRWLTTRFDHFSTRSGEPAATGRHQRPSHRTKSVVTVESRAYAANMLVTDMKPTGGLEPCQEPWCSARRYCECRARCRQMPSKVRLSEGPQRYRARAVVVHQTRRTLRAESCFLRFDVVREREKCCRGLAAVCAEPHPQSVGFGGAIFCVLFVGDAGTEAFEELPERRAGEVGHDAALHVRQPRLTAGCRALGSSSSASGTQTFE